MTAVIVEHTDGRELARIADVPVIPRIGEFIEVLGDTLIVKAGYTWRSPPWRGLGVPPQGWWLWNVAHSD